MWRTYCRLEGLGACSNAVRIVFFGVVEENVFGDVENVVGDVENVFGDVENVVGDVENVVGDVENVVGDVENVFGDVENVFGDVENVFGDVENVFGDVENGKIHSNFLQGICYTEPEPGGCKATGSRRWLTDDGWRVTDGILEGRRRYFAK